MRNQSHRFLRSIKKDWSYAVILFGFAFGLLALAPSVQAQEGSGDPVTGVEVTIGSPGGGSGGGSGQAEAVTVTSGSVFRNAVTTCPATIFCHDQNGNAVPNAAVSSISITSPGSVSPTSGTTDANGNLSVTVKSTDLSPDDATATLTATSEGVSGSGSVKFKGALRIFEGTTDITETTTACNVGEPQAVTATILGGVAVTSATWTASGAMPIGGWQPTTPASTTTPFPPDTKSEPTTTLYLTTTGSDTLTLSASDAAATGSATTGFTVSEPSDFSFTAVQAAPVDGVWGVGLGGYSLNPSSKSYGIVFTGSGGEGGSLTSAQIITAYSNTVTISGGQPVDATPPNIPGLDTKFPYAATGSPNDSPGDAYTNPDNVQPFISNIDVNNFSATMYLMWTSSVAGSIAIPVENIGWTWNAHGTFNPKTGQPLSLTGSKPNPSIKGTPVNNGVLIWTQTTQGTSD